MKKIIKLLLLASCILFTHLTNAGSHPTSINIPILVNDDDSEASNQVLTSNGFEIVFPNDIKKVNMKAYLEGAMQSSFDINGIFDANKYSFDDTYIKTGNINFNFYNKHSDFFNVDTFHRPLNDAGGILEFDNLVNIINPFITGKKDLKDFAKAFKNSVSRKKIYLNYESDIYFPKIIRSSDGTAVGIGFFYASNKELSANEVNFDPIDKFMAIRISPDLSSILEISVSLTDLYEQETSSGELITISSLKLPVKDVMSGLEIRNERLKGLSYAMSQDYKKRNLFDTINQAKYILTESRWWQGGYSWKKNQSISDNHSAVFTKKTGLNGSDADDKNSVTPGYGKLHLISKSRALRECEAEINGPEDAFICTQQKDMKFINTFFDLFASNKDESDKLLKLVNINSMGMVHLGGIGYHYSMFKKIGDGKYLALVSSPEYSDLNNIDFIYYEVVNSDLRIYSDELANYMTYTDKAPDNYIESLIPEFISSKFSDIQIRSFYEKFLNDIKKIDMIIKETGIVP